jgi:hypothetical protein
MCTECRATATGALLWAQVEREQTSGAGRGAAFAVWRGYHFLWVMEQLRASGRAGAVGMFIADYRDGGMTMGALPPPPPLPAGASSLRWFRGHWVVAVTFPAAPADGAPDGRQSFPVELTALAESPDAASHRMEGWLREAFVGDRPTPVTAPQWHLVHLAPLNA